MTTPLIIFGTGKVAEVVYQYFLQDDNYTIIGFCCDDNYRDSDHFLGLPVLSFETLTTTHPANDYQLFIAIGYHEGNRIRAEKFQHAKAMGYRLATFIDPSSFVAQQLIDEGKIGENVLILDHVTVQPGVTIADNVFVWSQAMIGHHSHIEAHCWINSQVTVCGNSLIGALTYFGVNATVGHEVAVGESCFIGANALVTKNADAHGVYIEPDSERYRLDSRRFWQLRMK